MKNFKLCSILIVVIVMMTITSCGLNRKWVTTPIVPDKVISIVEEKPIFIPPVTITKIKELFMFDHDSYVIPDDQIVKIDKIESLMKKYPDTVILIRGWASSEGFTEYNQTLSENRADAIKIALTEAGIEEDRIEAIGAGETKIFGKFLNLNRRVVVLDVE